jgi:hypothetical protein
MKYVIIPAVLLTLSACGNSQPVSDVVVHDVPAAAALSATAAEGYRCAPYSAEPGPGASDKELGTFLASLRRALPVCIGRNDDLIKAITDELAAGLPTHH